MSRRVVGLLAAFSLVACLIAMPAAHAGDVSHARIVRLSYTQGDVQFRADAGSRWQKAIVNTPLREGMSLATGEGRAEVEFEVGAMLWMASNSVVEFRQLALEDGAKLTELEVKQGTATIYVNPGRHDSFAVQAGGLLVAAPDTTRFRADVFDDGAAVSVLHGAVEVTARGETQRVSHHKTLAVRNDAAANAIVSENPRSDAWDRWVSDRSDAVDAARLDASDYLDAPFGYGMADLSFYGGWVDLPGYGMGWQPFGIGLGWSPFYNGYWGLYGGFGPTWISYEPWGWLPYHYGGWIFSPVYGWVWVPGSFGAWSPATVLWVNTPGGIGWVARAPREKGTGTPANLSHGVITNTAAGMLAGSRNRVLRGSKTAGVSAVGSWTDSAELARWSRQAESQAAATTGAKPRSTRAAMRMPEGPAPRIATAGMYAGRVLRYSPPSPPRGAGFGYGAGSAPSFGESSSTPSMPSSGKQAGGAPIHGGASGSGGGGVHRGKP
jgi:Family of unknown function (DUF6600)/FecR protein